MTETDNNKFMRRCIELALKAEGLTYPNPMVGSVIVYEGRIIGEGFHLRAGEPHAEVNAIRSVTDKSLLRHSTLFVNLEPCSHFGKTPPCADLIIAEGIPEVVVGTIDTSSKVSGRGVQKLKDSGCNVTSGVLNEECRRLNRRFFSFHEKKRPYIIIKWAQSADGYIGKRREAGHKREPYWITGKAEKVLAHKWRSTEQSILAGARTVITDNPGLNVREWSGPDPLKLILSGSGSVSGYLDTYLNDNNTVVFTYNRDADLTGVKKVILKNDTPSAFQICDYLYAEGIQSLFIEGGAKVIDQFISTGLWDEARIFTGYESFHEGIKAPDIPGAIQISENKFEKSNLRVYLKEN